jgi:hypothetical protein
MSQFDDDLEQILGGGDFDTEATVTTPTGDVTLDGWFTGQSDETVVYGQVQVEAQKPSFTVQTDKLTGVKPKQAIEIDDVTYQIERMEKLGIGVTVLYLKT